MGFWDWLFGRKAPATKPSVPPPATQAAAPSVDPREYLLKQVETILRGEPGVEKVERHPELYGLQFTRDGRQGSVFLDNLYADTRDVPPEARPQIIQRFLKSLRQEGPDSHPWEDARQRLLPVLRASTFGMSQLGQLEADRELVGRRTVPYLLELLVLDLPESAMFVQRRHLQSWGVSEDEAFAAAHENLGQLPLDGVDLYDREPSPIWSIDSGDTYETSRLLYSGLLASFAERVEGRPIAILPERSTVLIAGDANPATVARLCESGEREYEAATRRLTPALYTVDDAGRMVPYLRPGDDSLAQRVRLAHVRLALSEYAAQKEALDKVHETKGVDVFVATLSAVARKKDQRPITWCVWSHDVDALLPRADVVAVHLGSEDVFMVPWEDVERLAPGCLTLAPETWPPRHRTTTRPTPEMMERLRAARVELEDYAGT
ncbi:DUF1444 family protein [Pyxidicoccus parkwayensis]|uniref:DUF1444 family protein n=1 Tax=Pyxidicoccus parkwayensis TaxID=2813578 RepID=A0ABX7NTI6_9BACT|nr:DUF1444 family protein [Pyxidicoccus parkwaysis]QSQ22100.1 DUF1444 family protein [Pyxidicoccus parkwaysis]